MNQNQTIVVLIIIGGAVATIAGAWWLSQREAGSGPSITTQPFRAQPGTEREQRLEPTTPAADAPSTQAADPDTEPPPILEGEVPAEPAPAPVEDEATLPATAAQALAHPNPAAGLEGIYAALATASLAEASALYAAAGTLYLQHYPPNESASIGAFERAIETATEPRQAQQAAVQLAEVFVSRGEQTEALEVLDRVMPMDAEAPRPTRAAVRLRLFQGGLFEDAGDTQRARACFEEALGNARVLYLAIGDDDTASVYRQASLALARHHRNQGNHETADDIVARMRATLGAE